MGEEPYDARYSGQDGCNQQKVRFARDRSSKEVIRLPRRNLPEGLQRRLKIRITVADLAEFQDELESALTKLDAGDTHFWSAEKIQKEPGLKENFKIKP